MVTSNHPHGVLERVLSWRPARSDDALVQRVRESISSSAGVSPDQIKIRASRESGTVELEGVLTSGELRRKVIDAAQRVHGVRHINSYLKVE